MGQKLTVIPMSVIYAAMEGDAIAIDTVISHYRGYIRALATRPIKAKSGDEYLCIDDYIQSRLEAKLAHSIVTGFKILSD